MKNNYLALGGLFACLHVLFLLLSKVVVGSELLLVLFLPLLSTIYTLKCDKKNILMFAIATVLVCGIFDIVSTFIYIIPSLVCGILYGFLRKNNFKELELLYVSSIGHIFSLMFSFFIISVLFKEIEFMNIFGDFLGLNGNELVISCFLFFVVLGFAEAFLVHVVCDSELAKISGRVSKNECVPKWFFIAFLICFSLFVILLFISGLWSVIPLVLSFIFVIPYIVFGVMNLKYKILTFVLIGLFFFISIVLVSYINPLYFVVLPVFTLSPFVINNFKDIK